MNFFDQSAAPSEPPPPSSEADYGANVVALSPRKRAREGWKAEWHLSSSGTPLPTLFNVLMALRNHPKLIGLVRYDEMALTLILAKQIPNTPHDPSIPRPIRDADVIAVQEEIQLTGLRRVSKSTVGDALDLVAEQDRFHPVREYLTSLEWDGVQRCAGWLSRYLGVEGSRYADTIGKLFLVALVARVMRPGCKADYMMILEGAQGARKSTACRVLAGKWFSDNLPDLARGDPVRLSMHLRGKWLVEIAEMSSFSNAEVHTLKEFLTQSEERYTPKYGRHEVLEARQCLFLGSTNEGAYLRDATGARRFWPVKVGEIDLDALRQDRDQLLAEAVHLFNAGEPWWPDREFEREFIAPEQEARYEHDPWEIEVRNWLERETIYRCTGNDILRNGLSLTAAQIHSRELRRISAIMQRLGWVRVKANGIWWFERESLADQRF